MTTKHCITKILTMVLCLFLFTCQEEQETNHHENTTNLFQDTGTFTVAHAETLPHIATAFNNALATNILEDVTVSPFIHVFTNPSGKKSYSSYLHNASTDAYTFYNIAIEDITENTLGETIILEYITNTPSTELNVNNLITSQLNVRQLSISAFMNLYETQDTTTVFYRSSSTSNDFIPCDDVEHTIVTQLGDSASSGGGFGLYSSSGYSPTGGGFTGGGPIGGWTTGWVEICSPVLRNYHCNGPNSGTPHPMGPNSLFGGNSCGDASTNYGGTGVVVAQACMSIFVTVDNNLVQAFTPNFDLYPNNLNNLDEFHDLLTADALFSSGVANLNDYGLQLANKVNQTITDVKNGTLTIGNTPNSTTSDSYDGYPPPPCVPLIDDVPVALPSDLEDYLTIANCIGFSEGLNQLDAVQHAALADYINKNGCSETTQSLVEDAINDLTSYTSSNYPGMDDGLPFNWWNDDNFVENNIILSVDYEGINDLTELEKILVVIFPAEALIIRANVDDAHTETENRFGFSARNDKSDAFRHAFFNAMNSNDASDDVARLFSTAHESEVPENLILEVQMDLHNNDVGHTIGNDANFFVSDQELSNSVYSELLAGNLLYLSPLDPVIPPNFGINSSTQLTPTNQ